MSHFNYTKPAGVWTDGVDNLDATALASFEAKMFKAVNGDEGGSWAPSSAIAIGGSGLEVSGDGLTAGPMKLVSGSSYVANTAALKALTGMVAGQTCWVKRQGLYLYEDPDASVEALPFVVEPTSGTGRWYHSVEATRGAVSGLAPLDGSSRVPAVNLHNILVNAVVNTGASSFSITSTPYVDTGLWLTVTGIKSGDLLFIDMSGTLTMNGGGAIANFVDLQINLPTGTGTQHSFAINGGVESHYTGWSMHELYTCSPADETANVVNVKLYARRPTGDVAHTVYKGSFRGMLVRP